MIPLGNLYQCSQGIVVDAETLTVISSNCKHFKVMNLPSFIKNTPYKTHIFNLGRCAV